MPKYVIKNVEKKLPSVTIFYPYFHLVSPTMNPQFGCSNHLTRINNYKEQVPIACCVLSNENWFARHRGLFAGVLGDATQHVLSPGR